MSYKSNKCPRHLIDANRGKSEMILNRLMNQNEELYMDKNSDDNDGSFLTSDDSLNTSLHDQQDQISDAISNKSQSIVSQHKSSKQIIINDNNYDQQQLDNVGEFSSDRSDLSGQASFIQLSKQKQQQQKQNFINQYSDQTTKSNQMLMKQRANPKLIFNNDQVTKKILNLDQIIDTTTQCLTYKAKVGYINIGKLISDQINEDNLDDPPSDMMLQQLNAIQLGSLKDNKNRRVKKRYVDSQFFSKDFEKINIDIKINRHLACTEIGDIDRGIKYLSMAKEALHVFKNLKHMQLNRNKRETQKGQYAQIPLQQGDIDKPLIDIQFMSNHQLKHGIPQVQEQTKKVSFEQINKKVKKSDSSNKLLNVNAHARKSARSVINNNSFIQVLICIALIFCCIFQPVNTAEACPNKGRYVTYNATDFSQTKVQYSFCQAKVNFNPIVMDSLSYMQVNKPCIYEINNVTKLVVDSEKNDWYLYQYNNIVIEKGKLRYSFDQFVGAYSSENRIVFQYKEIEESLINNKTSTRLFSIYKFIELIKDEVDDIFIANRQFKISHKMLNQKAGLFRWSNSRSKYILEDGFQNCKKVEFIEERELLYNNKSFMYNNTAKYKDLNPYVIKFLMENNAIISTDRPIMQGNRILHQSKRQLQVSLPDWNGLQMKTDSTLLSCKLSLIQDAKGNYLQSCQYRYLIETAYTGKIVWQGPVMQLSILNPIAVEQYSLRAVDYDCLKSEASYHYSCECLWKTSQNEYEHYEQGTDIKISSIDEQGFLSKEQIGKEYFISKKCFGQGGDGCIIPGNPRGCVEQKETIKDYRAKLYQLQYFGVCVTPTAVWKNPALPQVQITTSLQMCNYMDSYNAVKDFYNNTIYSITNNEPQIVEDYVMAFQSDKGDFYSLNSKEYLMMADFVQGVCPTVLAGNLNIVFPKRKYSVTERSCRYDEADIKEIKDFITPKQNFTTGLFVFTRFTKIFPFDGKVYQFFPPQEGQKQVRLGESSGGTMALSIGDRLCTPQYAYCINQRTFLDIMYCSLPDKAVDKIMVVQNGRDVSTGRFIVLTYQQTLVCLNLQNSNDLCDDIRFDEHAVRFVKQVSIDGMIELAGLWAGMNQAEQPAKDCKINKPLQYLNGGITSGEVCCNNDGVLRFTIDDGINQLYRSVNTNKKCYSFADNSVFFKNLNYEQLVIKLPNIDGIVNVNTQFKNLDYKPMSIIEETKPQFNLLPVVQQNQYSIWINRIVIALMILIFWIIFNALIYAMDLHYNVSQGGDKAPSIIYLLLGGGIINIVVSFLAKSKQYIFTKNQKKKLKVDKKLLKQFLKEQEEKTKLKNDELPVTNKDKLK